MKKQIQSINIDVVCDVVCDVVTDVVCEIDFENDFESEITINRLNNFIRYDLKYQSDLLKFEYYYRKLLSEIKEISFNNLTLKVKNFEYETINEIINDFESDFENEIESDNIKYYESNYNFANTYKNDLYSLVSINYDLYKLNEYNLRPYFVISFKKYEYDRKSIFIIVNNRFLNYIDNKVLNYKFKGLKHEKAINICNNRLNRISKNKRLSKAKKAQRHEIALKQLLIAQRKQSDYKIGEYIANSHNKCYFGFLNDLTNDVYTLFKKSNESDFSIKINEINNIFNDFVKNNCKETETEIKSDYKHRFNDIVIDNDYYNEIIEIYYNNNDFDKNNCFKYIDSYFENLLNIVENIKENEIKVINLKKLLETYLIETEEAKKDCLNNQGNKWLFRCYKQYLTDIKDIESEIKEIENEIENEINEINKTNFNDFDIIENEIEIAFNQYENLKDKYYKKLENDYNIYEYDIFESEMKQHNTKIRKEQSEFLRIAFNESLNDFVTTD